MHASPTRIRASVKTKLALAIGVACSLALMMAVVITFQPPVAEASCNRKVTTPPGFRLRPDQRILFFGDSITRLYAKRPFHYGHIFELVLRNSYCEFANFSVDARGRSGSNYRIYRRAVKRYVAYHENARYDWVMFQDAGRALSLDNNRFQDFVRDTVASTQKVAPGARVLLATTPPLDREHAGRRHRRRYDRQFNFRLHNIALREIAADGGLEVLPWAGDLCDLYTRDPFFEWTSDGIHPTPAGHLVLALSILKYMGAELQDLDLTGVSDLQRTLTPMGARAIAGWVFNPIGACPAG